MKTLLTAYWLNLLTATFETEKKFLQKFLPAKTELNDWNGKYLISLVAFMFERPSVAGIRSPFFKSFEEINLRFYVRCKEGNNWKNGVVFIREIAPSPVIGFTASLLYKESFISMPMNHQFIEEDRLKQIKYSCKKNNHWNYLYVETDSNDCEPEEDSIEFYIRNHFWAYTKAGSNKTSQFRIEHRPWKVFRSHSFTMDMDINAIYGKEFEDYLPGKPLNSFLMDGSFTRVSWPALV